MSLFGLIDFEIIGGRELSIADEVAILHENHNVSIEKLTMDLFYDRKWCKEQGIRYYDLRSPIEGISAFEIAENFVINSIFNSAYIKNGHS